MKRGDTWAAWIQIVTGIGVLGLWAMLLLTDQVSELATEPYSILTHIAAESLMALLLVLSGILELRNWKNAPRLSLFALGTLAYSVLNSSGYYLDRKEAALPLLFLFLMGFVLVRLRRNFTHYPPR